MVFANTPITPILTHTDKHTGDTGISRLTHTYKCTLTPPAMSTQQQPMLQLMNTLLIQKFTLQRSPMSLLFSNYSLVEVIYLGI